MANQGNCLVKTCYVEEIVSKVIITAFDHLLVSKMPKKHGKNEDNRLFPQNQDSDNPGQTSLGQYSNIHIFLSFLGSLLKQCILPSILVVLAPPTLYKVETRKKLWIHASNILCGVRGRFGPV